MKKIEVPIHPRLETIFGYPSAQRWVAFWWDDMPDQLMYSDGQESGSANSWAYLIWSGHPSTRHELSRLDNPILLLDREERVIYTASRQEALFTLHNPVPYPKEIAQPQALEPWKEAQQLLADFVVWLGQQTHPASSVARP